MTSRSIADSLTPAAPFDAPRRAPELDLDTFFDVSLDLLVVRELMLGARRFSDLRAALPGMKAKGWGRIINVASTHGLVASAQKSAYVAAKHGIVGLTKVTALETATTGITANAICPGWVLTPLVQKQVDAKAAAMGLSNEEAKKVLLQEKEPSMQFTTPEELGELAVFFCSAAGNNVRGVAWNMDGGWTAQ